MWKNCTVLVLIGCALAFASTPARSSKNSESESRAANSTGTISIKENYSDSLTFDINNNPVTGYGGIATIKGTLALTNNDGASVTADTVFNLTAGGYSTTFRVGDDPKYKSKAKKANGSVQTVLVDLSTGKAPKKVKATLALSWKPTSLTFKLTVAETDTNKIPPVFGVLRNTPGNGGDGVAVTIPVTIAFGTDSAALNATGSGNVTIVPLGDTSIVTASWIASASVTAPK